MKNLFLTRRPPPPDGHIGTSGRWPWMMVTLVLTGFLIGLHSAEQTAPAPVPGVAPIGTVVAFGGAASTVAESGGWMVCDGRELAVSQYSELYRVIGSGWGGGRGGDTFRLPDLRGRFLRGVNYEAAGDLRDPGRDSRGISAPGGNAGNEVGSIQEDTVGPHHHVLRGTPDATGPGTGAEWVRFYSLKVPDEAAPVVNSSWAVQSTDGEETRPRNVYVNWIIRVR